MSEVWCAFQRGECWEGGCDGVTQGVGAPGGGTSDERLELGEDHLDGVEVGRIGGQEAQQRPRASMAARAFAFLWTLRLSQIATSPGLRVGASICSTQAQNASPSIAFSMSIGESIRSRAMRRDKGIDDVTAPDGINVRRWVCDDPQRRAVMSEIITVGLDLAKNVFQVHGADASGLGVLR
jgi:hypothetical protein